MNELLLLKEDASETIYKGIKKLYDAVSVTLGPYGSNVIIPSKSEYGKFTATKDGVSVAEAIEVSNIYENIAISMAREVAKNTVEEAGDGTTTSIVLLQAFIDNFKDVKFSRNIRREFDILIEEVVKLLVAKAVPVTNETLRSIIDISSNGDDQIVENIMHAYEKSHDVDIELVKSHKLVDRVERFEGMFIPEETLYTSVSADKEFSGNDARVILHFDKITEFNNDMNLLLSDAVKKKSSVLIVTSSIGSQAMSVLDRVSQSSNIQIVVVKTPGFADHRVNLFLDIAKYISTPKTSQEVILNHNDIISDVVHNVSISNNKVIIQQDMENIEVSNSIKNQLFILESQIESTEDKYQIELLNSRISRIKGRITTIYIGGHSEADLNERYDRYDDAVKAAKCAIAEGVVKGGGITLLEIADEVERMRNDKSILPELLANTIKEPHFKIIENGCNFNEYTEEELSKIVDPVKVTRVALLKAANFAKVVLSTKGIVLGNFNGNGRF